MADALLDLRFFLLMLNVEFVLSVCDVRVHTIDFGCHLEWKCPDANPKTTYTVSANPNGDWTNVLGCIRTSQQSCDLSSVFPNLNVLNSIRLTSEELSWTNKTYCDPINDSAAKFSPPSITISVDNGTMWVMVHFPCAPSISCRSNDEEEEWLEEDCCPLNENKDIWATVTLYNKHNLTDRQSRTDIVKPDIPFRVEFGFLVQGQEYCATANFKAYGVSSSSPASLPKCVYIPANTERLMVVIVCAVFIALGLVFLLLWRLRAPSERPLPRSLTFLQELEVQKETFIDSMTEPPNEIPDDDLILIEPFVDTSMTEPPNEMSEDDAFFAVSYFLTESQPLYQNTQTLGNGYYSSPVLHNPGDIDENESGETASGDQIHELNPFPSSSSLEGCPYQSQREETLNIPLSSVWVKNSQQEETEEQ